MPPGQPLAPRTPGAPSRRLLRLAAGRSRRWHGAYPRPPGPRTTTPPGPVRGPGGVVRECGRSAAGAGAGAVALIELLDPAGGVEHALVAGPERVRGGADLDRDHGQRLAVQLDRPVRGDRRPRPEGRPGRGVLEDDGAVLGVDAVLHGGPLVCAGRPPPLGRADRDCPVQHLVGADVPGGT